MGIQCPQAQGTLPLGSLFAVVCGLWSVVDGRGGRGLLGLLQGSAADQAWRLAQGFDLCAHCKRPDTPDTILAREGWALAG